MPSSRGRRRAWWPVRLCVVGLALGAVTSAVPASGAQTTSTAPVPQVDRAGFKPYGDLAFISEGSLWALDGATGRLTLVAPASQQPSAEQFSPNGRWLSYSVGSGRVWVTRPDGRSA